MHLMVLVSRGFCNTYAKGNVRKRIFQLEDQTELLVPKSVEQALKRAIDIADFEGLLLHGVFGDKAHLMRQNKGGADTLRFCDEKPLFLVSRMPRRSGSAR